MPRTPRNPGTGKAPVNTPASGAGRGGPANGAGWGGAAQGAHASTESLKPFQPGNPGDPSKWPMTDRRKMREEQHQEHLDRLHRVAMGLEAAEPVQVKAAEVFRDSTIGPPRQTQVNINGDVAEALERMRRRRGDGTSGD